MHIIPFIFRAKVFERVLGKTFAKVFPDTSPSRPSHAAENSHRSGAFFKITKKTAFVSYIFILSFPLFPP